MLPSEISCSPQEDIKDKVEGQISKSSDREEDNVDIKEAVLDKSDSLTDIESLEMPSEEASTMEIGNEGADDSDQERIELENQVKECVDLLNKSLSKTNQPKDADLSSSFDPPPSGVIIRTQDPDISQVPFFYYITPKTSKFPTHSDLDPVEKVMKDVSAIKDHEDEDLTKVPFLYYVTPKRLTAKKREAKFREIEDRSSSLEIDDTTYDSVRDFISPDGETDGTVPFLYYVTPKGMKGLKKSKRVDRDKKASSLYADEKEKEMLAKKLNLDIHQMKEGDIKGVREKSPLKKTHWKKGFDLKDQDIDTNKDDKMKADSETLKEHKPNVGFANSLPPKQTPRDAAQLRNKKEEEEDKKTSSEEKREQLNSVAHSKGKPDSDECEKPAKQSRLQIFRRLYHSEEPPSSASESPSHVSESAKSASGLERPKKLKFHRRSKSEKENTPSSPIKGKQKKSTFAWMFGTGKDKDKEKMLKEKEARFSHEKSRSDSLKRSPSYEIAITQVVTLTEPKKPGLIELSTSKIKQLFKRPTESEDDPSLIKIEGANAAAASDALKTEVTDVQDLSARHPSISMYIDETPVSASPLTLGGPSASSFVPPCEEALAPLAHPEPSPSPLLPNLSTPFIRTDSLEPNYSEVPSNISSPSHSSSPSPSQHVSADTSKATHERKLTFALPFGSAQPAEDEAVKPMERAIEARSQLADYIGSMVRCLHLTKCYIASSECCLFLFVCSGFFFIEVSLA